jgi:hypothetical protein
MATVRLVLGPSSESLQGKNRREMSCRRCRAGYGDLICGDLKGLLETMRGRPMSLKRIILTVH